MGFPSMGTEQIVASMQTSCMVLSGQLILYLTFLKQLVGHNLRWLEKLLLGKEGLPDRYLLKKMLLITIESH